MATLHHLKEFIESKNFEKLLPSLYGDMFNLKDQKERFQSLIATHENLFDTSSNASGLFSTAGRSELAGNHTDHNMGKVIAATINLDTICVATPTKENTIVLISEGFKAVTVDLFSLEPQKEEIGQTDALVRGIVAGFAKRGYATGGFVANTTSRIFKGSGLSSSAAVEILIGTILNHFFNDGKISSVTLSLIGKEAENIYFGKPSGLMDQIACAYGGVVGIDFKSPEEPIITPLTVNFRQGGYDLLVVNVGASHADLTDDYAAITAEMKMVASFFNKSVLREISLNQFLRSFVDIRAKVNHDRALLRAYHYLSENERVSQMLTYLENGEIGQFLEDVKASGNSSSHYLQNLYSVSLLSEQSLPLALALTERFLGPQGGACRVHGGGFGGTIQVYVPTSRSKQYIAYIESFFGTGSATTLEVRSLPSTRLETLS